VYRGGPRRPPRSFRCSRSSWEGPQPGGGLPVHLVDEPRVGKAGFLPLRVELPSDLDAGSARGRPRSGPGRRKPVGPAPRHGGCSPSSFSSSVKRLAAHLSLRRAEGRALLAGEGGSGLDGRLTSDPWSSRTCVDVAAIRAPLGLGGGRVPNDQDRPQQPGDSRRSPAATVAATIRICDERASDRECVASSAASAAPPRTGCRPPSPNICSCWGRPSAGAAGASPRTATCGSAPRGSGMSGRILLAGVAGWTSGPPRPGRNSAQPRPSR
jgi:hypothetical protein